MSDYKRYAPVASDGKPISRLSSDSPDGAWMMLIEEVKHAAASAGTFETYTELKERGFTVQEIEDAI